VARAVALLATLFVLVSCGGSDTSEAGTGGGEIAFTVNRDGWGEIWLMRADGTDRTRLTDREPPQNDASGSTSPVWSPDGTLIAYTAQIGTPTPEEDQRLTEIYVMRADGTDVRRLTTNEEFDAAPSWSPDGQRIAFARISEPGTAAARGGIFVLDADGGGEEQLTDVVVPTFDFAPAWSPDGTRIAFARSSPSAGPELFKVGLYVVTLEGGAVTKLTSEAGEPDWSPDGTRLAFTSYRDLFGRTCFHDCNPSGEIYVMDAEGGQATRLTETEANDHSPAWSPDGRLIAFVSDRSSPEDHENEIYVMNADGGDVRRITENDVWDLSPAWRPDR
jgi:TolB protein